RFLLFADVAGEVRVALGRFRTAAFLFIELFHLGAEIVVVGIGRPAAADLGTTAFEIVNEHDLLVRGPDEGRRGGEQEEEGREGLTHGWLLWLGHGQHDYTGAKCWVIILGSVYAVSHSVSQGSTASAT